ncbi:hypothetical protein ACPPVW_18315 [Leifsonia sp. McL0607]
MLDLQARIRAMQGTDLGEKRLPMHPATADLLPEARLASATAAI